MKWAQKQTGFTIVELLIVVVVIAILATITIVSYNGITNRANDAAIQSDLRNFINMIYELETASGVIPAGRGSGNTNSPTGLASFRATKTAYDTTVNNLYYCANSTAFAVAARSKSGTVFMHHSSQGSRVYTGVWGTSNDICPGMDINGFTFSNGHGNSVSWYGWVRG